MTKRYKFIYQCKECKVVTESNAQLSLKEEREFSGTIEYEPKRYWECLICGRKNYVPKKIEGNYPRI